MTASVRQLDPADNTAGFCCGRAQLDNYFAKEALRDHQRLNCCYVLVDPAVFDGVIGFYTLSAHSLTPIALVNSGIPDLPSFKVPVVRIGMFAVHEPFQGRGFGRLLMRDALGRSLKISREVGAIGVYLDALDQPARSFYERLAFTSLSTVPKFPTPMLIAMATIEASLPPGYQLP